MGLPFWLMFVPYWVSIISACKPKRWLHFGEVDRTPILATWFNLSNYFWQTYFHVQWSWLDINLKRGSNMFECPFNKPFWKFTRPMNNWTSEQHTVAFMIFMSLIYFHGFNKFSYISDALFLGTLRITFWCLLEFLAVAVLVVPHLVSQGSCTSPLLWVTVGCLGRVSCV